MSGITERQPGLIGDLDRYFDLVGRGLYPYPDHIEIRDIGPEEIEAFGVVDASKDWPRDYTIVVRALFGRSTQRPAPCYAVLPGYLVSPETGNDQINQPPYFSRLYVLSNGQMVINHTTPELSFQPRPVNLLGGLGLLRRFLFLDTVKSNSQTKLN